MTNPELGQWAKNLDLPKLGKWLMKVSWPDADHLGGTKT